MYNVDYFIKKFEKIPENRWCTGVFINGNKRCALGHCGARLDQWNEESEALYKLFNNYPTYSITVVNDGPGVSSIKQRILHALRVIKESLSRKDTSTV